MKDFEDELTLQANGILQDIGYKEAIRSCNAILKSRSRTDAVNLLRDRIVYINMKNTLMYGKEGS